MRTFIATLCLLIVMPLWAMEVSGVRLSATAGKTRVVLDLGGTVEFNVFELDSPDRVVIDLRDARLTAKLPTVKPDETIVKRLRSGIREGTDLRIVLDLHGPVNIESRLLAPDRKKSHRLEVALSRDESRAIGRSAASKQRNTVRPHQHLRDVIIAIDAGHGGADPGAAGVGGTKEKDVVLAIARRLASLVNNERGMRAVLIRDGDHFISLRQRMQKARRHKADLFISLHADAFRDHRVQGSSVYVLSERGASSEAARWLAEQENNADLVGGVTLSDKDPILKSVLLDLSQTAAMHASFTAAEQVLRALGEVGRLHKRHVQSAGFVVLKSPDIPSMLIETAFISNPREERRLTQSAHQIKLAKAILRGVREYFHQYPPPDSLLASR